MKMSANNAKQADILTSAAAVAESARHRARTMDRRKV